MYFERRFMHLSCRFYSRIFLPVFFCFFILSPCCFAAIDKAPAFPHQPFLENKGQVVDMQGRLVPSVLFKTQGPGLDLYITEKGLTYCFIYFEEGEGDRLKKIQSGKQGWERRREKKMEWSRVDMD